MPAPFSPALLAFLKQLKTHNDREWFNAHKVRYVAEVEDPARAFVEAFAPKLKTISPRFVADSRKLGGSMFRIYRDTRFSHNKAPFKTHVGLRFWHDGKGLETPPLFYLHLQPGESFGGGGIYHPDPATLRKIRLHIDEARKDWKAVRAACDVVHGESLSRVPAGFAKDHPFADDLKRKGHVIMVRFTDAEITAPDFLETYAKTCRSIAPLMKFLVAALGQRW